MAEEIRGLRGQVAELWKAVAALQQQAAGRHEPSTAGSEDGSPCTPRASSKPAKLLPPLPAGALVAAVVAVPPSTAAYNVVLAALWEPPAAAAPTLVLEVRPALERDLRATLARPPF